MITVNCLSIITHMELLTIVQKIDGYLHCLRRLGNNSCDFWADAFELDSNVDLSFESYLSGRNVIIDSSHAVGYTEICNELDRHVFNNLLGVTPDQKKLLEWDILECIEMACLEVEEDSNPVLDGKALLFDATSEFHRECIYLVFPVNMQAIVVGLATRT